MEKREEKTKNKQHLKIAAINQPYIAYIFDQVLLFCRTTICDGTISQAIFHVFTISSRVEINKGLWITEREGTHAVSA